MNRIHLFLGTFLGCSLLCLTATIAAPLEDAEKILRQAKKVEVTFSDGSKEWKRPTMFVGKLDNGVVVVKSSFMTLDTDGASEKIRACDPTAQPDTALSDPQGNPTDSNTIPYYVLPGSRKQLGLRLGNLAAVLSGDKIVHAIAADIGPEKQFGEGSVELHRELGHETVGKHPNNHDCTKDESLEAEVIFVIFPGSNAKGSSTLNRGEVHL